MTVELTYFNRLEPRPRDNDFTATLAAEVRDPLWFLARQWHVGEFEGEDAGSLAFIQYSGRTSNIPRWLRSGVETPLEPETPLERQTLREPFTPDLSLQVELGHDFADFLLDEVGSAGPTNTLLNAFRGLPRFSIAELPDPEPDVLNPTDAATKRFLVVCAGKTLNGFELFVLGQNIAAGTEDVPTDVTTNATRIAQIEAALERLVERVGAVFGEIGPADPVTWTPDRLEYRVQVIAADPNARGNATLDAYPDSDGEYEWYSFDVATKNLTAPEVAPDPRAFSIVPARVRFPGMPVSRFWAFEENDLALPDIAATGMDDLLKLLVTDFMLQHANEWHVFPFEQTVGTLAWTDWIIVHDVFGVKTIVRRADLDQQNPGTNRWTMFSTSDLAGGANALADYFLLPPTSGAGSRLGTILEDVRFARDEMANMGFGVERTTLSLIGEARSGTQRDADVNAARNLPLPTPTGSGFPLKYEVESEIPANWIPLLPRQPNPPNPSIVLQRGQAVKANGPDSFGPVPSLSKILQPTLPAGTPYLIQEEEIPRGGLRVQRVVYRARWTNGSTHLWVQRRRQIGAGESQSGLRFDQALPNDG